VNICDTNQIGRKHFLPNHLQIVDTPPTRIWRFTPVTQLLMSRGRWIRSPRLASAKLAGSYLKNRTQTQEVKAWLKWFNTHYRKKTVADSKYH
jgi:hypothetical protein